MRGLDTRTLVQRGQEPIFWGVSVLTTYKSKLVIGTLVIGWLFALSLGAADRRQVVGRVVASYGVTLEGVSVLNEDTILAGDLLKTPKAGNALVKFSPASRANIAEETSVRFGYAGKNPLAQLSLGTIVTTTQSNDGLVVETPKYRVEPAEQGKAVHVVAVLRDDGTVVEARHGGVSITEISSGQRYVLPEGKYAKIAASSVGVPPQENQGDQQGSTGGRSKKRGAWHIGSLSHGASIAVVALAAAGATAAIVVRLATASPSTP